MLAVNTAPWNTLDEWIAYWKSKGAADVTWASDTDQILVRQFSVRTLGTTIILGRDGSIAYRDDGATPYEVLQTAVAEAL